MELGDKTEFFDNIEKIEERIKVRGRIIYKNTAFALPCNGCKNIKLRLENSYNCGILTTEFYSCHGCRQHSSIVSFNIHYLN